jgi:hypothetical protein
MHCNVVGEVFNVVKEALPLEDEASHEASPGDVVALIHTQFCTLSTNSGCVSQLIERSNQDHHK